MRIKNIVIVFALFVIGILAVDKKCLAYTLSCSTSYHSINTNNVDSVSNTAYFRVGDTVYSNAAIDTQSDIMKYYYARIEKNGAVIYSSSENYTYGIRWFSWGHVFNSPGEYVFKFEERDQNGTSLGVQSTFYVRDSIPKIQSSPSSRTVKAGNATVFSVSATGTNLKYQWGYNYTGDTNRWYEISGATSSSYTILANAMTGSCDGRYYFCRVSNYGNDNFNYFPATFKIKYYVNYDANGGSGAPFEQWKYYDSTLVLRSGTPIRAGYTFKGWSTSSTATSVSYMPGGTYTANRDMTLYAVWKAMPTVTPTPRPGSSINQGTQITSQPSSLYSSTGLYTPASAGNNKKKAAKLKIGSIVVKNSLVCKVTSLTGKKGKLKVIRLSSNKLKKVIIPQKIKMNGVNFAVTVIGKNVFNKKCKRLKVIFIKSTKLTKFEKNKISKKCKIIVPKSKVKKYTKLVKKWR